MVCVCVWGVVVVCGVQAVGAGAVRQAVAAGSGSSSGVVGGGGVVVWWWVISTNSMRRSPFNQVLQQRCHSICSAVHTNVRYGVSPDSVLNRPSSPVHRYCSVYPHRLRVYTVSHPRCSSGRTTV